MKYLLLFFLCFNTYAQFKVEITPSDSKYAKKGFKCVDVNECQSKLVDWLGKDSIFSGSWGLEQEGSIAQKDFVQADNSVVTLYYVPTNFTVATIDISAELADAALEAAIAKRIACGEATIRYITKNNALKNLTTSQRRQMISIYSDILDQLKTGAVDIAKEDMQNFVIDGVIVTEIDRTNTIAFIESCE